MGKKIKNPKLLKQGMNNNESMLSLFNKHANKVAHSHHKKIEKMGDTKQRLMEAKKTNKMVKVSKRTSKFALIEDGPLQQGLTHRGKAINDLKEFNDMNFGSDAEDDEFLKQHENLNFTGFDDDEEEKAKANNPDRPKSKADIYKEIIEKSKLHKHIRQEMYEENLEKAVELDNSFDDLVGKLKFRNRDRKVKDQIVNVDHEFERLANELKEDERVVSNKVMQKNEKYTQKLKRKKNQQLNSLMKDSDSQDIRDWAKNVNDVSEQSQEQEDELDDVEISSEEEEGEQELSGEDDEQGDEEEQQEQEEQEESEEEEEVQEQELPPVQTKNVKKSFVKQRKQLEKRR